MKVTFPTIPDLSPTELWHGWLGQVEAGEHTFRMKSCRQPDNYSSLFTHWVGTRSDKGDKWKSPDESASENLWSPYFEPDRLWLSGGSSGNEWDETFKRAADDLVQKLLPERIDQVEFTWGQPPELVRQTNGSQAP